jgi:hypothetical protein
MNRAALVPLVLGVALVARGGDSAGGIGAEDVAKLAPFLARGELILAEPRAEGGVGSCSAITSAAAPIATAWETLLDFRSYASWVPRVSRVSVTKVDENVWDVAHDLSVPMQNLRYTIRYTAFEKTHTLDGKWVSGDLGGGHWVWHLYEVGGSTVVTYGQDADVSEQSRILKALDDPKKTLSSGLGLASVYLMARATKLEMERRATKAASRFR